MEDNKKPNGVHLVDFHVCFMFMINTVLHRMGWPHSQIPSPLLALEWVWFFYFGFHHTDGSGSCESAGIHKHIGTCVPVLKIWTLE